MGCPNREHFQREHASLSIDRVSGQSGVTYERFAILPDIQELTTIVDTIDKARERIWVEIYTWTEKSTLEAVIRAKNRGVDIRVVLEGNVYFTPRINDPTFEKLKSAGIPVIFADNRRYTFTHAKFWIIDNRWCLSTGNWSYTTFSKNREFIYCSDDLSILSDLREIFLSDARHELPYFSGGLDSRLGVSPIDMRRWLMDTMGQAKKSLYIYNQSLSDEGIIRLLQVKKDAGVDVRVCTTSPSHTGALSDIDFQVSHIKKPYLHAKLILIDDEEIVIGSINFTQNAIDNNREIGFLIEKNEKFFSQAKKLFLSECLPE